MLFPQPARCLRPLLPLTLLMALAGCDMLGIETPALVTAKKEAEGKAIGSACRHAVRSIEDCYRNNPKALKASVFDGWREMDAYMRENNIEGMPFVPPVSGPDESLVSADAADHGDKKAKDSAAAETPAKKADSKH